MKTQLRVFLATDYSGYAECAEQYAVHLAKQNHILGILNVFNPSIEGALSCFEPENPLAFEEEKLQQHVVQLFDNLHLDSRHLNYKCLAKAGINIAECIIEEAGLFDADFIIMGTHGAGKLREVMLGSHTWDVIRQSNIPVLAIPDGTNFKKIEKFVFITECREREIPALQLLSVFASQMEAELVVLHIADNDMTIVEGGIKPDLFFDNLRKRLNIQRLKTEIIFYDRMADGLNHYCKRSKPNWLIVSSEKLKILNKLFKSEAAEHKMSFISHIPLLVIPDYGYLLTKLT